MNEKLCIPVFLFVLNVSFIFAQDKILFNEGFNRNEKSNEIQPCISDALYRQIEDNSIKNEKLFLQYNKLRTYSSTVQLSWPLQAGNGLTDCSYYYISAHVDQDTNAVTFSDYNCGAITYDGHKGTDIAIGPFPFHKMDSDQVEVIAAAPGTIVDKHDGEFDKNCVGVGSNLTANYIMIEHADGSRALYFHMKKNSLTSKAIGQTVVTGEFLGIVGSSGSSSGPHLHFEVWAGSTNSTYNDPFSGTCNHINANSWWATQKPYTEPAVLKASVHTTDVVMPACPATETLNESSSYTIPFQGPGLSPGYAKFYIFLRNETSATTVNMSILNPNSTVYLSWTRNCVNSFNYSYYGYSKLLPTQPGIYTFQATYNNITCSQTFQIVSATGISENENNFYNTLIYPNPINTSGIIQFNSMVHNARLEIYDALGNLVKTIGGISGQKYKFNRENLSGGSYFIRLSENENVIGRGRIEVVD